MIVRTMSKADTKEVAELEAEIFSMPWSRQGFEDTLTMPNVLFLVAWEEEALAGYCGVYMAADEGEITNVAVKASFRKRGIGEYLVKELMKRAREEGVCRFILEVRESNAQAVRLYERLGFSVCGRRKHFYEHPAEDALVMSTDQEFPLPI